MGNDAFLEKNSEKETTRTVTEKIKLSELDRTILTALYDYRAFTIEQLSVLTGRTKRYMYLRVHTLKERGLIKTCMLPSVKGNKSPGKYVRISENGIQFLKKVQGQQDLDIVRTYNHLTLSDFQVRHVIAANEIMLRLKPFGWEFEDARSIKRTFKRNRNEYMDGALVYRGMHIYKQYVMYTLLEVGAVELKAGEPNEKVASKLLREIQAHAEVATHINVTKKPKSLTAHLYLCKEKLWYDYMIRQLLILDDGITLARLDEVKIMPYERAINYIPILASEKYEEMLIDTLLKQNGASWSNKRTFEWLRHGGFTRAYTFTGMQDEIYVLNLLDMDLIKLFYLRYYNQTRYEEHEKRKVIVLIPESTKDTVKEYVQYPYVDYVEIKEYELQQILPEITEGLKKQK